MVQNNSISSKKRLAQILGILRTYHITKGMDPIKLRMIIEELGPAFVKIGQIMSTRQDMFSKRYCDELKKLRSDVAPLDFEVILKVIEDEYGCAWNEIFSMIDQKPLGSASIAQVHYGRLLHGEEIVIKVQRPHIYELLERDIMLLRRASSLLHLSEILGSVVDPDIVLEEFWQTAKQEMDFTLEAKATQRFQKTYEALKYVGTAAIYQEYTTGKILVMEYIDGIAIDQQSDLLTAGYDCEEIAEKLADHYITQIIEHGWFHADPHPGNVRIRDGRIIWIDFGMMGQLEDRERSLMKQAVSALVKRDASTLTDVILRLGIHDTSFDYPLLLHDIEDFMNKYLTMELIHIHLGVLMQDMFTVVHKHHIAMPKGVSMLARGMVIMESTLMSLNPAASIIEIAARHIHEHTEFDLYKEGKQGIKKLYDTARRTLELPIEFSDLLRMMKRGYLKVNLELMESREPVSKLDKMVNRIIICMLTSALLLGSSLICTTDMTPKILGIPALGFFGYVGAMLMGIWLLVKMISLRHR